MREFIIFKYKIWEAKARQKKKSSFLKKSPKTKKIKASFYPTVAPTSLKVQVDVKLPAILLLQPLKH